MQGTVLNQRYRLLEKVGEGGMAQVFRAEDTLLERTVAVKLLREQYAADPDFLARFQQEARSAARVTHPNIVTVYDVGADGQTSYIVLEYVEGTNLKALLRRGTPLSAGRAVEISIQVLTALAVAHQKGLIHRDVKPQNILVGADGQVKVADFGIARAANTPQLTATGVVLATVQYCSPEQATGRATGAASDLYSLGVVLYEMLTGELPFEAESPVAVALKHLQEAPRPPRELNPAIPRQLEAIVLRALAKSPEERFGSALEMRQALRSCQQFGQEATTTFRAPTPAPPPSAPAAPAPTTLARSRPAPSGGVDWLAVFLGVLVFVLVAGAVPLGVRVYGLLTERPPAVPVAAPTATPEPPATATPLPPTPTPLPPTPTPVPPTATATSQPVAVVPRLIGQPYEQARRDLEARGLSLRIAGESFHDLFEPMVIVFQSPQPDARVAPGGTVEVVVSRGPEKVPLESVVGVAPAEARARLEAAGFQVVISDQWSDRVAAGLVAGQSPEAGELVARRSQVTLLVSKGPPPPTPSPTVVRMPEGDTAWVPDVVGKPEAEARRLIELAGLKNTYTNYQVEADIPEAARPFFRSIRKGHVVSTDPKAGERLSRGGIVRIAVRKE